MPVMGEYVAREAQAVAIADGSDEFRYTSRTSRSGEVGTYSKAPQR